MDIDDEIGKAYLQAEGLSSELIETIHPDDEMFSSPAALKGREQSARLDYFKSGREVIFALENILQCAGKGWSELDRVLEFACGCGRVTRHLIGVLEPQRIVSSDILEDAVAFVGQTFGVRSSLSVADVQRLELDAEYDLIFVASLFSHLPRHRFVQWLDKLYRALRPGGILAFSTHGLEVRHEIAKDPSGFTFVQQSESLSLSTEEYGSTFLSPAVLRSLADECGIPHLAGVERELWGVQDLYVASNQALPGFDEWQNTSVIRGIVDRVQTASGRRIRLDGWAAESRPGERVEEVSFVVDGQHFATATLGQERADVAQAHARPDWSHCGWYLEGVVPPEIPAGPRLIATCGRSSSGRSMCFDVQRVEVP